MDDKHIIKLFHERNENAIAEVQTKYGALCHNISRNILHSDADSEECVSDTYLVLWNTIPPTQPDSLVAYIARIAQNLSTKRYHYNTAKQRNSIYDVALSELEDCIPCRESVEDCMDTAELSQYIDAFLDSLPKKNRVIFVRRYFFSDSVSDIAKIMDLDARKVTLSLYRTREKLKKYLVKKGVYL